jgi:hypothetical protein
MIFVFTLPGVPLANVAYKWLVAGVWGSALTAGITDTAKFDTFVIDAVPPTGAQEIVGYDVTDESNRARGNYLSRIISGGASVDDIAARIIADHGSGSYAVTGGGSGAYLVTVTVTDQDDNPLENATVRLTQGINAFTDKSDVDGLASFNLDAATYALGVYKDGYQFTPSSIVVTGPDNFDAELTRIVPPVPGLPSQCVCSIVTRDGHGAAQAGVILTFTLQGAPFPDSYATGVMTATSDVDGLLTVNLRKGASYEGKRGPNGNPARFNVPYEDSFQLPQVLGEP